MKWLKWKEPLINGQGNPSSLHYLEYTQIRRGCGFSSASIRIPDYTLEKVCTILQNGQGNRLPKLSYLEGVEVYLVGGGMVVSHQGRANIQLFHQTKRGVESLATGLGLPLKES